MSQRVLVYWAGIVGIAGKGPNWVEPYRPDSTFGQLAHTMEKHGLGDGKRVEFFKFEKGNMNRYDKNNPYWSRETKLSEYAEKMGGFGNGKDLMIVYHIVSK